MATRVRLIDSTSTTAALDEVFSDAALLGAMVRFETALARAEAEHRVIPPDAGRAITTTLTANGLDPSSLTAGARTSGTLVIPLVDALVEQVRRVDPSAATFVHWGATSQDVADTAIVLCLLEARTVLDADHRRLTAALAGLSREHASTVMLARTLLQPAAPTTFGLKAAGWFGAVSRSYLQLRAAFDLACVLQFGGAAGTLAALRDDGPKVAATLARELALSLPDAPWHSHRDRLAALVCACGVYVGSLGKVARDISLLMQQEIGEAAERGGGSSAMPHKRNPAGCAIVLAAANRLPGLVSSFLSAMLQEHERAVGGWQAEAAIISDAVKTTGSALAALVDVIEGLTVDPDRMLANLRDTKGTVYAERAMTLLAPALGKKRAAEVVAEALRHSADSGTPFQDAIAESTEVRRVVGTALTTLGDPRAYLGAAEYFRTRLLTTSDTTVVNPTDD
jgi:3-carboxy-cis,cis-muconate cycloisomerase